MREETYKVRIKGTRPLLQNNPACMETEPKRRGEQRTPEEEAEMRLYKDDNGKVCVPAFHLKRAIAKVASGYRIPGRGSQTFTYLVRAALTVIPTMIPIEPQKWVVDLRPVVVQKQRIIRARPRFDEWSLAFTIKNSEPDLLKKDTVRRLLEEAGRLRGIGDFRPEYGTFVIEEFS